MQQDLVGTWAFRRTPEPDEEETICEIHADGRIAQYFRPHPSLPHVGMTLRATAEGPGADTFRVRPDADAEGYLIAMHREGANLIIVNKELRFVCRPISAEEQPGWLPEARYRVVWR